MHRGRRRMLSTKNVINVVIISAYTAVGLEVAALVSRLIAAKG